MWKRAGMVLGLCSVWAAGLTEEGFRVRAIDVVGLHRISEETFFNYLPFQIGDAYTDLAGDQILRQLHQTHFFEQVSLSSHQDHLVITVVERPVIAEVVLHGEKAIKADAVVVALKEIGLYKGRTYDRSVTKQLATVIERLYYPQGRYAATARLEERLLEPGRIQIHLYLEEGEVAHIAQMHLLGTQSIQSEVLLKQFQLSPTHLFSWWTKNDQYSKQRLEADLEHLRAFYLDHGFLNIDIPHAQVALDDQRQKVYITIRVSEGVAYRLQSMSIEGETNAVPRETLLKALQYEAGELFSRHRVSEAMQKLISILGEYGYADAQVEPVPTLDEQTRTLNLVFHIQTGVRYQVRFVEIQGNQRTHSEIIRREIRQKEGSWLSMTNLEASKDALSRTGFIENSYYELRPVSGTKEMVDLVFHVEESSSLITSLEGGYGRPDGFSLKFNFANRNFLGLGRLLDLQMLYTKSYRNYDITYQNPYYTRTGIARGFNLFHSKSQPGEISEVADYKIDATGVNVNYAFPVASLDHFHASTGIKSSQLLTGQTVSDEIQAFIDERNRKNYVELHSSLGWEYNSLNRFIFPTNGQKHNFNVHFSWPFSHLEYYRLQYHGQWVKSLNAHLLLLSRLTAGYGDGYRHTRQLPFFKNFFMGGPRSLRGYAENAVGPRDSQNRPMGGNAMLAGSAMLAFPTLLGERAKEMRLGVFIDAGQVYQVSSPRETAAHVTLPNRNPAGLRQSVGVALTWMTPVGLLEFSWAQPIGERDRERVEKFSFSIGSSFY